MDLNCFSSLVKSIIEAKICHWAFSVGLVKLVEFGCLSSSNWLKFKILSLFGWFNRWTFYILYVFREKNSLEILPSRWSRRSIMTHWRASPWNIIFIRLCWYTLHSWYLHTLRASKTITVVDVLILLKISTFYDIRILAP